MYSLIKDSFLYILYNLLRDFKFSILIIFTGFVISICGQSVEMYGFYATGNILMIEGIVLMFGCFIVVGYDQARDSWSEHK